MDKFIYKLKKPIELRNAEGEVIEKLTELALRELKGADADRITGTAPIPIAVQMVGAASDLPPSTVAKIPLFELLAASEAAAAQGFFGDIPATLTK